MRAKILGFQILDYVSKKTGKPVKGVTLHIAYSMPDIVGSAVKTEYISSQSDIYNHLAPYDQSLIGKICICDYAPDRVVNGNMTFKLSSIDLVKSDK